MYIHLTLEQHRFELCRSTYTRTFFNKYIQYYTIRGWFNPQMQNHGYGTADTEGRLHDLSIRGLWYPRQVLEPVLCATEGLREDCTYIQIYMYMERGT